jgi:alpha-tubulin suppressor-like RCC1 family protein
MRRLDMTASVSAWGDNTNGQLGDGSTTGRLTPVRVGGLSGEVTTIEAGSGHVVALLADGTALAWGRNIFGQLALGTTEHEVHPVPVPGVHGIASVACGGGHTLFLLEDGTVLACGAGFFGAVGDGARAMSPVPVPVSGVSGVRQVAAGGAHSLALLDDGSVWTWGRDDYGQLGDGTDADKPGRVVQEHAGVRYPCRFIPAPVEGLPDVTAVAAGGGQSLALLADGTVLAWGFNDSGQLGDGTTTHRPIPGKVPGLAEIVALAGGYHHTLALRADGTVWAFGLNDRGQLGDGSSEQRRTPVQVAELSAARAIAACGGGSDAEPGNAGHSVALLDDGTVWTWGCNNFGALGDGTTASRQVPVQVSDLPAGKHITAGGEVPQFRENPGGGFTLVLHK